MRGRFTALSIALATVAVSCVGPFSRERTIVASFYPIAYAAERIAGPGWRVVDLTSTGAEAHDIELTLNQRSAIENADVVFYFGDLGFQPQVEAAVKEANGTVVSISHPKSTDVRSDVHVWLWPDFYLTRIADHVQVAMWDIDPANTEEYERRAHELFRDLEELQASYDEVLLGPCEYRTAIISHEAFGYLLDRYHMHQFGLAGLEPEGEPTLDRIAEAERLIADGEAGAIFYEPTEEGLRVAENIAGDAGVPALPLSTLESQPPEGDYLSVMEDNLESLREGLQCR